MSMRRFLFFVLPIIALLPSNLYGVSMGNFGGKGGTGGMGGKGSVGAMVNKINIQTQTVGIVVFSHNLHGTNCNQCHPNIFKKKSNSNHVSMKLMERGRSCGACHNGRKVFSVKGDCDKCHAGDITFTDKNIGNTVFSHSVHIEMLGGCDSCHPDLFKPRRGVNKADMAAMKNGESCGACHDGSTAFGVTEAGDCDKCHAGDILFKDEDAGNVTFSHSSHIEMLGGCDNCHPKLFKPKRGSNKATMEDMESGKSCGGCHDGSTAFNVAEDCGSCHDI